MQTSAGSWGLWVFTGGASGAPWGRGRGVGGLWFCQGAAPRARLVVVAGAAADPDVLGRRDLDVVDVVAVPDRLEHEVREPERHHVLDGLLAQVVIDAVVLLLAEDVLDDVLELARGLEVEDEAVIDGGEVMDRGAEDT